MAIVNLRGTSGAGKTTIVKAVMERYADKDPQFQEGRRQPYGYWFTAEGHRPLWVVGHYETATGGCDTIGPYKDGVSGNAIQRCYDIIHMALEHECDVIYEGLVVESDVKRCIDLHHKKPGELLVILLSTPIEECIKGVEARRAARGADAEFNHGHLRKKDHEVRKQVTKFKDAGVDIRVLDREAALKATLAHLGWE